MRLGNPSIRSKVLRTGRVYSRRSAQGMLLAGLFTALAFWGCSSTAPATTLPAPIPGPTLPPQVATQPIPDGTSASAAVLGSTGALRLIGSAAPDFYFRLFQGEEVLGEEVHRLAQLEGRPIVLNFWARFCGPCWTEMPELQEFYEEYGDRLRLLGIDLGQFTGLGSPKDAGKLLESLGVTYPAGFTDDAHVVRSYQVAAMPTTVFINAEGIVVRTWSGAINRHQLETVVTGLFPDE